MEQHKIDRINELAKASRTRELTESEKAEQKQLRAEYIESYRNSLRSMLDNTYIQYEDGKRVKLKKKEPALSLEMLKQSGQIASASESETEQLGCQLAQLLEQNGDLPRFIALYGDLGTGKTAFVRCFCGHMTPGQRVHSPSFTLVNEYNENDRSVFHFDLYRIDTDDQLESIGFYDYLDRQGYCLAEWSEKIPWALPDKRIEIRIEKTPQQTEKRLLSLLLKEDLS